MSRAGGGMREGKASAQQRGRHDVLSPSVEQLRGVLPPHYLRRPRLFEFVDRALAVPLVVVTAAAGTGKTSLLAGWALQGEHPTAWVTVPGDEDASRVMRAVVSAIHEPDSGAAQTLVIDNVHTAESSPGFAALLAELVTRPPRWLHIVLLGRRDPPLPLDRFRAGGQLAEIRAADLMFTPAESADLLARLAPGLSAPKVRTLTDLVGGWPAGLQLAALAVRTGRSGDDADVTRTTHGRLVRSYVLNEVLGGESTEMVSMLKGLAVVEGGDAQLAGTLTQRADAVDLLAHAHARGFVVPTALGDRAFAVHPFIRPVLLDDLADRSPHRAAELHVRAARSLTISGDTSQALDQWLLAGNPEAALRLLAERAADLYDTGQQATIVTTIAAIPVEVAARDLAAMIDYTWCHLLVSRRRFLELVGQITWWADRSNLDRPLRPRVTILRSFAAWLRGRWGESIELARAAMADLGADASRDRLGRFGWNMLARGRAMAESWTEGADAEWELVLAVSRDPLRRIAMDATRALGQALAGDANRALVTAAEVRANAPVDDMAMLRAELLAAEGIAHRELGHRARARAVLETLTRAPPEPMAYSAVLGLLELTELRLSEADIAGAVRTFESARVAEQDAELIGERVLLARVGAAVELARGDTAAAQAWAEQLDEPFWSPVTTARVLLARGDRAGARATAPLATPRCARHRVVLNLLRARLAERNDEAIEFVTRAVTEAAEHGMRQTVASEDSDGDVLGLVERATWVAPADWTDGVRRLAATAGRTLPREPALSPSTLSRREREVLRLLPSRLTTREIAVELGISPNTLKYHLKTIYRKLAVNSRAEAAELVRSGGVLRPPAGSRDPKHA